MLDDGITDIGIVRLLFVHGGAATNKRLADWVGERGSNDIQWLFLRAGGTILPREHHSGWLGWLH